MGLPPRNVGMHTVRANPKPISKATTTPRMASAAPRTIATQPTVLLMALPQQ